jgi:type VI protein secretion system component VasF
MIVVEAGHAHVIKFLPISCELSIFVAVIVVFWIFFFKLTIESKNIELFGNQF